MLVAISQLFLYMAMSIAPVTVVSPINRLSILFRLYFSRLLNPQHEVFGGKVVLGTIVSLSGAVVLSLSIDSVQSLAAAAGGSARAAALALALRLRTGTEEQAEALRLFPDAVQHVALAECCAAEPRSFQARRPERSRVRQRTTKGCAALLAEEKSSGHGPAYSPAGFLLRRNSKLFRLRLPNSAATSDKYLIFKYIFLSGAVHNLIFVATQRWGKKYVPCDAG